MSVLITFIKLISVFDLLVIAVYFGGDILSTMLNILRRTPKQDDPFDFSLDTLTVSLSIDSIRQPYSGDAADFVKEKILPNVEKTMGSSCFGVLRSLFNMVERISPPKYTAITSKSKTEISLINVIRTLIFFVRSEEHTSELQSQR